jgi:glycosyltransferase involved in cell wall biosynthesis
MRILWVKVGGLWPLSAGGRLRSFHILKQLSARHHVTLLTTHGAHDDPECLVEQLPRVEVVSVAHDGPKHGSAGFAWALGRSWLSPLPVDLWRWRVPALRAEAERRLSRQAVDVCVADFLAAMPSVPKASSAPRGETVPVVLFEHNVEHMIWRRLALVERRLVRRSLLELEYRKMRRYEAQACTAAHLTLTVSDADRMALAELAPEASTRLRVVPTGVDTSYYCPNGVRPAGPELVFTGSMDWYPNEDAILHFVDGILPRIRAAVPAATLSVVGRAPSPRLRDAVERAGGRVTGTVPDVRPYVGRACVFVVPLRVGGGTRLKIFEALAMGKAVVSTTVGAEGLPITPGVHFMQADDTQPFADAVISLLRDPERRRALGEAGRRLVEEQYSWTQVARAFESACTEAVHHAH